MPSKAQQAVRARTVAAKKAELERGAIREPLFATRMREPKVWRIEYRTRETAWEADHQTFGEWCEWKLYRIHAASRVKAMYHLEGMLNGRGYLSDQYECRVIPDWRRW